MLRTYVPSDCADMARLFYDTVHTVNARDYNEIQLNAWAGMIPQLEEWNRSFLAHLTMVALEEGKIVGFGDMSADGYLDRLYVHKDFQGQGIAAAICDELEKQCGAAQIITHASVTAKPFFEKRGYLVVKEQEVECKGVKLKNYVMKK